MLDLLFGSNDGDGQISHWVGREVASHRIHINVLIINFMDTSHLILLGTGSPNILPDRAQGSLAIVVNDTSYLVDCGGGAMQRISQARATGASSLEMPRLTRLFLTHLHPDHTTGLATFIIAPWVLGRLESLNVHGPSGTRDMCEHILAAYEIGIDEHRDGLASINHPLTVQVHEIEAGEIYADENVTVEAFRVQHGRLDAFGFKFITPDKRIVISGDTRPTPTLIEKAKGCDILVHEVYSALRLQTRSARWQTYHTSVHTSTVELADIANQTRPGLLVLVHQLYWGTTEEKLLEEITALYDGPVVSGRDLGIYS